MELEKRRIRLIASALVIVISIGGGILAYLLTVPPNRTIPVGSLSDKPIVKVVPQSLPVQSGNKTKLLMDPTIIAAVIGALATVVAAVIGQQLGKKIGRWERDKEIDDAPRKYVDHLDKLIQDAVREGSTKAVLNARAIVSTRNDLRESMMKISERLNSEIDRLGREIGEPTGPEASQQQRQAVPATIYETIQVLAKKWPVKKDQVEIELRKVLAELGILGRSPNQPRG